MSKITAIKVQEKNKNRCNVFVDGEFSFAAPIEIVLSERLKVNDDVDKNRITEIVERKDKSDALTKAVGYISKAIKTKKQVKDYLVKKGYTLDVAFYVIDKLKEYGYIDDVEYSKRYIESTKKTQGKRLLQYKLMCKGVKKEDIESACDGNDEGFKDDAFNLAKKYMRNKEETKENLSKTYRYLIGRGFSYEEAEYALSQFKGD